MADNPWADYKDSPDPSATAVADWTPVGEDQPDPDRPKQDAEFNRIANPVDRSAPALGQQPQYRAPLSQAPATKPTQDEQQASRLLPNPSTYQPNRPVQNPKTLGDQLLNQRLPTTTDVVPGAPVSLEKPQTARQVAGGVNVTSSRVPTTPQGMYEYGQTGEAEVTAGVKQLSGPARDIITAYGNAQLPEGIRDGLTQLDASWRNSPDFESKDAKQGLTKIVHGLLGDASAQIIPEINPAATKALAAGILGGYIGGPAAKRTAKALGLDPDSQDLAEQLGVLAGGITGAAATGIRFGGRGRFAPHDQGIHPDYVDTGTSEGNGTVEVPVEPKALPASTSDTKDAAPAKPAPAAPKGEKEQMDAIVRKMQAGIELSPEDHALLEKRAAGWQVEKDQTEAEWEAEQHPEKEEGKPAAKKEEPSHPSGEVTGLDQETGLPIVDRSKPSAESTAEAPQSPNSEEPEKPESGKEEKPSTEVEKPEAQVEKPKGEVPEKEKQLTSGEEEAKPVKWRVDEGASEEEGDTPEQKEEKARKIREYNEKEAAKPSQQDIIAGDELERQVGLQPAHPTDEQEQAKSNELARNLGEPEPFKDGKLVPQSGLPPVGEKEPERGRVVTQPTDKLAEAQKLATAAAPELEDKLTAITRGIDGASVDAIRPTKNRDRAIEKSKKQNQPVETISDLLAGRIAVDSPQARDQVVAELRKQFNVVKEDDNFEKGTPEYGYHSHDLQVEMGNGSTAEVQVVPQEIAQASEKTHDRYVRAREAEARGDTKEAEALKEINRDWHSDAMEKFNARNAEKPGITLAPEANKTPAGTTEASKAREELDTYQAPPVDTKSALAKGDHVVLPDGRAAIVNFHDTKFSGKVRVATESGDKLELPRKDVTPVKVRPLHEGQPWVGFDLDKTLAHYDKFKGPLEIGKPIPAMIDVLKQHLAAGDNVRILTARVNQDPYGKVARTVQAWLQKHVGEAVPVTDKKDEHMTRLYDDRAVAVEPNTGKILGGTDHVEDNGAVSLFGNGGQEETPAAGAKPAVQPASGEVAKPAEPAASKPADGAAHGAAAADGAVSGPAGEPAAPIAKKTEGIPPQAEPVGEQPREADGRFGVTPSNVVRVKTDLLIVSPKEMQFKLNKDEVSGASDTDRVWNEDLADPISVWVEPNTGAKTGPGSGRWLVQNGHHRVAINKYSSKKHGTIDSLNVIFDTKSKTIEEARAHGALINIGQGKGTAVDAAKFFRESGKGLPQGEWMRRLNDQGVSLSEGVGKDGLALANLNDRLFDQVVSGRMKMGRGVAIGEITADSAAQDAIMKAIEKKEKTGRTVTNDVVRELGRRANAAEQTVSTQVNLFGAEEITKNNLLEEGEISEHVRKQLSLEKRLFTEVANENKAERLTKAGNTLNAEENEKIAKNAAQAQEIYDRLSTRAGEVSDIIRRAGSELAKGGNAAKIKSQAYEDIRTAIQTAYLRGDGSSDPGVPPPSGFAAIRRPKGKALPGDQPLPGFENVEAERAAIAAYEEGRRLSQELNSPIGSIEKAAGEMERESPLFRGSAANPQKDMFGARDDEFRSISTNHDDTLLHKILDHLADLADERGLSTVRRITNLDGDHILRLDPGGPHEKAQYVILSAPHEAKRTGVFDELADKGDIIPFERRLTAELEARGLSSKFDLGSYESHRGIQLQRTPKGWQFGGGASDDSYTKALTSTTRYNTLKADHEVIPADPDKHHQAVLRINHNAAAIFRSVGGAMDSNWDGLTVNGTATTNFVEALLNHALTVKGEERKAINALAMNVAAAADPGNRTSIFIINPDAMHEEQSHGWQIRSQFLHPFVIGYTANHPLVRALATVLDQIGYGALSDKSLAMEVVAKGMTGDLVNWGIPEADVERFLQGVFEIMRVPNNGDLRYLDDIPTPTDLVKRVVEAVKNGNGKGPAAAGTNLNQAGQSKPAATGSGNSGTAITPPIKGKQTSFQFPSISQRFDDWLSDKATADGVRAEAMMRQTRGELERQIAKAAELLHDSRNAWMLRSRADVTTFVNAIETDQIPTLPAKDHTLAYFLRDYFYAPMIRELQAAKPGVLANLIQGYFARWWKQPGRAQKIVNQVLSGKRPFAGSGAFTHQRTVPLFTDGIALGLEPHSWNPVDISLHKYAEMGQFLMAHKTLNLWKQAGIAKFVRVGTRPPVDHTMLDDRIGTVMSFDPASGGLVLRGHYYAPTDAARPFNNYVGRGIRHGALGPTVADIYSFLSWVNNTMNALQLGVSAFHFTFTSLLAPVSDMALGIRQIGEGKPFKGAFNIASALTTFPSIVRTAINGHMLLREYMSPGKYAAMANEAHAMEIAGGRAKMNVLAIPAWRHLITNIAQGKIPAALSHIPGTLLQATVAPVMDFWVPRMKLGAFYQLAHDTMEEGLRHGWTQDRLRLQLDRDWDSIDNRYGQFVYANRFWNPILADVMHVGVRSVGWNYGSGNETVGGFKDAARSLGQGGQRLLGSGTPAAGLPPISNRTAFNFALPIYFGIMGAVATYLWQNRAPKDWKDLYYPMTPSGTRLAPPAYMKDIVGFMFHPVTTAENKTSALLEAVGEALNNRDFYGEEIYHKDDPWQRELADFASWAVGTGEPFAFQGMQKLLDEEGEDVTWDWKHPVDSTHKLAAAIGRHPLDALLGNLGFQPAPAYIQNTAAVNLAREYDRVNRPPGIKTHAAYAHTLAMRGAEGLYRRLPPAQADELVRKLYVSKGRLSSANVARARFLARQDPLLGAFQGLNPEQALEVYKVATPEERSKVRSEALQKTSPFALAKSASLSDEQKERVRISARKLLYGEK